VKLKLILITAILGMVLAVPSAWTAAPHPPPPRQDPAGGNAYVANHGERSTNFWTVSEFGIGPTGLLSPLVPAMVSAGVGPSVQPFGVAVSPDGKSVFVTDSGQDSAVSQFNVDPSTGELSPKNPLTVASGLNPEGIAVSPNGRSAYITNAGPSNDISQYNIDPSTGALSPKNPATIAPGVTPSDVAVAPDGGSAYVTTFFAGVFQYDIDPTGGGLSPKNPASAPTGSGAGAAKITVAPDGKSAYATSVTISQYNIDPATGALSLKTPATVAAGANPQGIAVTPDGKNAYAANLGSGVGQGTVSQYSIDAVSGALSPKTPATVAAGGGPTDIAVAPDGMSAYVTNQGSDDVSQYSIDPVTGALSPKIPATVATGLDPIGIAVRPPGVPTSKDQCKNGGWRNFPQFKNQGQCIAFLNGP
jgi:6-phosphogluconolactonase